MWHHGEGGPLRRHLVLASLALAAAVAAPAQGGPLRADAPARTACSPGFVTAELSWGTRCLRAGEYCKIGNPEYRAHGFVCPASGLLVRAGAGAGSRTAAPTSPAGAPATGAAVLLGPRTRQSRCTRGRLPDRRCSPGAYASGLTTAVICSPSFRTGAVRDVPQSEKFQVEREYGMQAGFYGRSLEIDHIVPLELGGSNAVANLFPEPGAGTANYHVKDELENRLHDLVCSGGMTLRVAQREIAANWMTLYRRVFGVAPV